MDDAIKKITDDSKPSHDPLIECLIIVAKHYHQIYTQVGLLAGLPVKDGGVDTTLFIRAAARANFDAKLNKATIAKLYSLPLPAILLLKHNKACVIEAIEENYAIIKRPEKPDVEEKISLANLKKEYEGHIFQLTPIFKGHEEKDEIKKKDHWLWYVVVKQLPTFSEVILASFLVNVFALASPLFIMNVYDKVIPNQAFETLWTLTFAVFLVLVFDFIMRELRTYFIDLSSRNVDTWFSATLFEQLLDIKMSSRPQSVGVLMNSMQSFEAVKEFLSSTTLVAIVDFPFMIIFLIIIYVLGGWIVFIPLTVIPLVLIVSFLNQLRLSRVMDKIIQLNSQKQAILVETLQNVQTVKLTLSEGVMQRRWDQLIDTLAKLAIKNRFYTNISINISIFSQYLASVAVVIAGVYRITAGNMKLGELIACTILAGRALVPVVQLATVLTRYKQAKASYSLVNDILALPTERPVDRNFLSLPKLSGNIDFNNVNFVYPRQKRNQLEGITFSIKAGERVGIIGLNGSGKTTILKLILKLFEATEGTILIDGIEIHQLDPSELRLHIGFVPQEVTLFQGSIKDNVKMGMFGVDDEKLIQAANLSGLGRFVMAHPEGFNRQVGEAGKGLSGGERQVIGFARALLQDPSLLIMDEPTNLMDELAVEHFNKTISELPKEKTIIIVTHKLDLLKLVSRLLVVHQGKIVADGTRDEILKRLGKQI